VIGISVLPVCALGGFGIGALIGGATGWEDVCWAIGGGSGFLAGLFLVIWVYRVRRRADAGSPQPRTP
jgi:hypothetical protein